MKFSSEIKVGILAALVITLLILGISFLKGNKIFGSSTTLYAKYQNIQGITPTSPVYIKGLQVGVVKSINNDPSMKELVLELSIHKNIQIPDNSVAIIIPNPLTITKVEIKMGESARFLKNNDYINTDANKGVLDEVLSKVDPVLYEVKQAVNSLDSLLGNINGVLDYNTKSKIKSSVDNLNAITVSVLASTTALQKLMDEQNGPLAKTLKNTSNITDNLAGNNEKINKIINNAEQATDKIAKLEMQHTLLTLDSTITALKQTIEKVNSKDGSIGNLMNDPALYNNLKSTSNKVNLLLDDIRTNPKRYISISVFGKKQKTAPLTHPTADTLDAPYISQ